MKDKTVAGAWLLLILATGSGSFVGGALYQELRDDTVIVQQRHQLEEKGYELVSITTGYYGSANLKNSLEIYQQWWQAALDDLAACRKSHAVAVSQVANHPCESIWWKQQAVEQGWKHWTCDPGPGVPGVPEIIWRDGEPNAR